MLRSRHWALHRCEALAHWTKPRLTARASFACHGTRFSGGCTYTAVISFLTSSSGSPNGRQGATSRFSRTCGSRTSQETGVSSGAMRHRPLACHLRQAESERKRLRKRADAVAAQAPTPARSTDDRFRRALGTTAALT